MKTINFELSKRLTEWGYLDNIETEYYINYNNSIFTKEYINENLMCRRIEILSSIKWSYINEDVFKTLTLEEALDFLPNIKDYDLELRKREVAYRALDKEIIINEWWRNIQYYNLKTLKYCNWKTLLEAIEKMIEYLLNNNLLTN